MAVGGAFVSFNPVTEEGMVGKGLVLLWFLPVAGNHLGNQWAARWFPWFLP